MMVARSSNRDRHWSVWWSEALGTVFMLGVGLEMDWLTPLGCRYYKIQHCGNSSLFKLQHWRLR
jgi:hypothetical protein